MIKQETVIEFFNKRAPAWDEEMIRSDEKIRSILDRAHVTEGSRVLDVACGTGVLIPDYLARKVGSVTGVDIAPEMIRIAESKFRQEDTVRFVCGDVEAAPVGEDFDCVVVYNAFPHFPDPARLIRTLAQKLRLGGTLTVAHGMSREAIDDHHSGPAAEVSNGLMPVTQLSELFSRYLKVTAILSDEGMYQVVGVKVSPEELHALRHGHTHDHGDAPHSHEDVPVEALLRHMAEHNVSHAAELEELAEHMDGAARDAVTDAVIAMQESNDRLKEALNLYRCGL